MRLKVIQVASGDPSKAAELLVSSETLSSSHIKRKPVGRSSRKDRLGQRKRTKKIVNFNKNNYWDESTQTWHVPRLTITSLRPLRYPKAVKYHLTIAWKILTGRWYSVTVADLLHENCEEVYNRLLNEWATMGVISALMLSFVYQSYSTVYTNHNNITFLGRDPNFLISSVCFCSFCLFLLSFGSSLFLTMGLMTLPKECSILFAEEMSPLLALPEAGTGGGVYLFIVNAILIGIVNNGWHFGYVAFAFGPFFTMFIILILLYMVLVLDREGGLWDFARFLKYSKMMERREREFDVEGEDEERQATKDSEEEKDGEVQDFHNEPDVSLEDV
jgi:hypothetical protein